MQHISCERFNELLEFFEDKEQYNKPFSLAQLANDLECSTQKIRMIRKGNSILDLKELELLKNNYSVNELWLTEGRMPYLLSGGLNIVSEPGLEYNRNYKEEVETLKKQLTDKEKIINLLEMQLDMDKKRAAG